MNKSLAAFGLAAAVSLSACGGGEEAVESVPDTSTDTAEEKALDTATDPVEEELGGEESEHAHSDEVPEGLQEAQNPAFEVGSSVVIQADHMKGMNGAEATVSGAFDTTAYTVTYTPTGGGEPVSGHKWIIHEEFENAGEEPLKAGDKAVINANHMEGMNGAEATIEAAEQTTVYMVDYTPSGGGEPVTNHKWLTESELSAAEQ